MAFFTEREGDLPPRAKKEIPKEFVEAIVNELTGLADRWWLARGWPTTCQDDRTIVVGTDPEKFWNATRAKLNLSAGTLQDLVNESNPLAVLNVIEFVDDHVAEPIVRTRHDYFGHNHLDFNGPAGKAKYRTEINDLFKRYGLAYQLTVSAHLKLRKSGLSSTSLLV